MTPRLRLPLAAASLGTGAQHARTSAASLLLLAALSTGAVRAQDLDATGETDTFARLLSPRAKTFVKASSDLDDHGARGFAGNDDGFTGEWVTEVYREYEPGAQAAVLTDIQGRSGYIGCFFKNYWSDAFGSMRQSWEKGRTQFLVDGAIRFDRPQDEFIRSRRNPLGQVPPFDGPFTNYRAGAALTHTPIPFQDSFKLRVYDGPLRDASRFHKVCGVLAGPDEPLEVPDLAAWERVHRLRGAWPHATERVPATERLVVPATGYVERVFRGGPAALLELGAQVEDRSAWAFLDVEIRFDDLTTPYVDVPLRKLGERVPADYEFALDALLTSTDGDRSITSWFPMPFRKQMTVRIVNRGRVPQGLKLTTAFGYGRYPEPWGYFRATWHEAVTQTGVPFRGPVLTDCHGVLRALSLESETDESGRIPPPMPGSHLEGDLCIRINGDRGDAHTFAATETSVGKWGWYGGPTDVPFSTDESYNSAFLRETVPGRYNARLRLQGTHFVFDPIAFVDGCEILLEHGIRNEANADYGLFAAFYVRPGAARQRFVELDVGDPADEARYEVSFDQVSEYVHTSGYFRDVYFGTPPVTDTVRQLRPGGGYRFELPLPPVHRGICLGFRLDRRHRWIESPAQARVLVDGVDAGLLHAWTSNPWFSWKEGSECEVEIPRALTDGKRSVRVEVVAATSGAPVAIARIAAFAYR